MRALVLGIALVAGGCASPDVGVDVAPTSIQAALTDCMAGETSRGIARLDSLVAVAPRHGDVLATRGLCRGVRFAADSVQADARAAFADLTAAIEVITASPDAFQTPLDRLYNHRAFVVQGMRPGDWEASIADFDRAVEAGPDVPTNLLDRGVAHAMAGDTAAARADLQRYRALVPGDGTHGDVLSALLDDRADSSQAGDAPADEIRGTLGR